VSERLICLLEQWQKRLNGQRRVRWQRRWYVGLESLVFEGLEDISPKTAVRFGWRRHHKAIVSLEVF
jgi:hypothetical protein